jgi:hypothetical protein
MESIFGDPAQESMKTAKDSRRKSCGIFFMMIAFL